MPHDLAVLQLSIHHPGPGPGHTGCTVFSQQRAISISLIRDDNNDNYQQLVAELGELVWNMRQTLRTLR